MASEKYEKARKQIETVLLGGVKIVFPAFDDLPEKTVWLGTSRFESADGDKYQSALNGFPGVTTRDGSAQDYAEFSLNDIESDWYETVKPYEEVFEDSRITIREFLLTEDDVFEDEIVFEGYLEGFDLNEADFTLNFSAISDMSRTGQPVGGRILSQRYCAAPKFNAYGLLSPEIDPCGWQTAQGGNPVFCTHKRTRTDGCEDHNNAHRFFAVDGLTSAQIQYVAGGGIGGGGWEYGGPNCFTRDTLIWMADGSYKPIWRVKVGDFVMSFTPSGEIVKRKVVKTFRNTSEHLRHLDFGKGRTIGTKDEHFFLTGKDYFQPADYLKSGSTVRCRKDDKPDGKWFDFALWSFYRETGKFQVHNFHVAEMMTYFVVLPDGTKIGVHNLKDYGLEGYQPQQ